LNSIKSINTKGLNLCNFRTIFVNEVDDPSKYGVIVADETGKIKDFIEKPTEFISNKINSGLYLFNVSMIDRIPVLNILYHSLNQHQSREKYSQLWQRKDNYINTFYQVFGKM
jgi:NDP-sugar pyrophosphorylase family protein